MLGSCDRRTWIAVPHEDDDGMRALRPVLDFECKSMIAVEQAMKHDV